MSSARSPANVNRARHREMTRTTVTLREILPADNAITDEENEIFRLTDEWLRFATEEVFNFDVGQRYPKTLRAIALLRDESVGRASARTIKDAFTWLRAGAFAVRLPAVYDSTVARELREADWPSSVRKMCENGYRRYKGDRDEALKALVRTLRQSRDVEAERADTTQPQTKTSGIKRRHASESEHLDPGDTPTWSAIALEKGESLR